MMKKPDHNLPVPAQARLKMAGAVTGFCLLLLLAVLGCSSSTEPPPVKEPDPPVTIEFLPVGTDLTLRLDETRMFAVTADPPTSLTVSWFQSGSLAGQDTVFTYVPTAVGPDDLKAIAFAGAVRDTYFWAIDVHENISTIPPPVPQVNAQAGLEPADVEVTWSRIGGSIYPPAEYLVVVSYGGPIDDDNWDQATPLGSYPSTGQLSYKQIYTQAADGMRPGERAWFAVRVRDDRQQLSDQTRSVQHDITWSWYLGGTVIDDVGNPLLGVIVNSSGPGYSANTDGSGFFLFDKPFRNIDSISVATVSPTWYDFLTPPIIAEQDTTLSGITLINHYGLGYDCYGGDFLDFLRDMTYNREVAGDPDKSRLYTWDQYPVSVFIPVQDNQGGMDMQAPCRAAMDFWNTTMRDDALQLGVVETDYFAWTTDEAAADIVFLFEYRLQNHGQVTLLLPGGDFDFGGVVPEKMQIWINTDPIIDEFTEMQGIALHEFGHALGLWNHTCSTINDYLMQPAGGGGAMARDEPIHLDERRAIRAIRNIPQGANMADYSQGRIVFDNR